MIFTFWEGKMPEYIRLCMRTWKFPYTVLNYDNLKEFTDFDIENTKRFTLPQIADAVRVHVLRDNGGYWLDTDTIMIGDKLPEETILGCPIKRTNTIGFLHTEPHSDMFEKWAAFQDKVIADKSYDDRWDVLGNRFTDSYLMLENTDMKIGDITSRWAETYMIGEQTMRIGKYLKLYFQCSYHLSDFRQTDMLMLHNSWTPDWYEELTEEGVLAQDCTLSNVLNEVLMK